MYVRAADSNSTHPAPEQTLLLSAAVHLILAERFECSYEGDSRTDALTYRAFHIAYLILTLFGSGAGGSCTGCGPKRRSLALQQQARFGTPAMKQLDIVSRIA